MSAKLGLPAVVTASLLLFAAPVLADGGDTTTTTTSTTVESPTTTIASGPTSTPTSTSTTSTTAPTTTATTTTTTTSSTSTIPVTTTSITTTLAPPAVLAAADPLGPATAEQTPRRGTQLQITPPPPPPVPWHFQVPANSGWGRRVVYSKSKQSVWVFDSNNALIKQHRVSGRQTPYDPAPGHYSVYSRSRYTYSINNPTITWGYMVRFAKGARGGNIGFHEIPYQYGRPVQSVWQLGQARSGGCVRQAVGDAIWMWNWAGVGTRVVVTP